MFKIWTLLIITGMIMDSACVLDTIQYFLCELGNHVCIKMSVDLETKLLSRRFSKKKWNKETWFFGESLSLQSCFDIYWPLVDVSIYLLNHVIVRPTKILIGKTILNNRLPFSTGQNFTSIQPCAPVWNEIAKRHGKMSSFRIDRTYSLGAAIRKNGAGFTSIFDRTVSS